MRKITVTLLIASLLSASSVAPSFAGGYYYGGGYGCNPLWPVAAALTTAAIIGSVVNASAPAQGGYGYAAPPPRTVVYSRPATYYVPGTYYAPRAYVGPRGYSAPRAYYPYRGYRVY